VTATTRTLNPANVDHDVQQGQAFVETFRQFEERLLRKGIQKLSYDWTDRYNRRVQILQDRAIAKAWRAHHKKRTVYRFLCTPCNNQSRNKAPTRKE